MNVKHVAAAVLLAAQSIHPALGADDPTGLSAAQAAAEIRAGRLSSEELTRLLIERARQRSGLNAFITLDEEGALAAARAADRSPRGRRGPLHGVPIVLKDNIHAAGMPNTAGTPGLGKFVPGEDAPVARRLREAGAILLGKTNMHELAFGITSNNGAFGAVGNPYEASRIAGGSSGGTAAAIAARMVPAGLGTDTGGSVRIPAALNGIAGLRPSAGRYLQDGITPISHTRDTAGPMARTVADLMLLDSAITGRRGKTQPVKLRGLRLGVPRALFWTDLDSGTARVAEAALVRLKEAGVTLVEADIPNVAELNEKVGFPLALYEVMQDLPAYLVRYRTGVDLAQLQAQMASPDVKGLFAALLAGQPPSIPAEVYRQAIETHRPQLQRAYAEYFKHHRVDAVIFPTTPLPAQPIGQDQEVTLNGRQVPTFGTFIRNTDPGSNAGIPGLSLPIGLTSEGLPVGLELDGPAGSDRRLLAIGLAMESLFGPLPPPR